MLLAICVNDIPTSKWIGEIYNWKGEITLDTWNWKFTNAASMGLLLNLRTLWDGGLRRFSFVLVEAFWRATESRPAGWEESRLGSVSPVNHDLLEVRVFRKDYQMYFLFKLRLSLTAVEYINNIHNRALWKPQSSVGGDHHRNCRHQMLTLT